MHAIFLMQKTTNSGVLDPLGPTGTLPVDTMHGTSVLQSYIICVEFKNCFKLNYALTEGSRRCHCLSCHRYRGSRAGHAVAWSSQAGTERVGRRRRPAGKDKAVYRQRHRRRYTGGPRDAACRVRRRRNEKVEFNQRRVQNDDGRHCRRCGIDPTHRITITCSAHCTAAAAGRLTIYGTLPPHQSFTGGDVVVSILGTSRQSQSASLYTPRYLSLEWINKIIKCGASDNFLCKILAHK